MAIPTDFDRRLGEIDNAASGILTHLRVLQRAAPRDVSDMRQRLRENLQSYADLVLALANESGE
jgi:hypothetical protein